MPRCKTGEKLLKTFRKTKLWKDHKKFDEHTVKCDICSGKNDDWLKF